MSAVSGSSSSRLRGGLRAAACAVSTDAVRTELRRGARRRRVPAGVLNASAPARGAR